MADDFLQKFNTALALLKENVEKKKIGDGERHETTIDRLKEVSTRISQIKDKILIKIKKLKDSKTVLENEILTQKEEISKLLSSLQKKEIKLTQLKETLDNLKEELEKCKNDKGCNPESKTIEKLKIQIELQKKEIGKLIFEKQNLTSKLEASEARNQQLIEKNDSYEKSIKDAHDLINGINNEFAAFNDTAKKNAISEKMLAINEALTELEKIDPEEDFAEEDGMPQAPPSPPPSPSPSPSPSRRALPPAGSPSKPDSLTAMAMSVSPDSLSSKDSDDTSVVYLSPGVKKPFDPNFLGSELPRENFSPEHFPPFRKSKKKRHHFKAQKQNKKKQIERLDKRRKTERLEKKIEHTHNMITRNKRKNMNLTGGFYSSGKTKRTGKHTSSSSGKRKSSKRSRSKKEGPERRKSSKRKNRSITRKY